MLLGIDLGTSSLRSAVVDDRGRILGIGQHEYTIDTPRPGWAEQDPDVWWHAACQATRAALTQADVRSGDIAAVGLSGQMHGTVLVDGNGAAIRPAIIWADARSAAQAERLNGEIGIERLAAIAGNRISPGFMAATLAWLHDNEPGSLDAARWALLPKDYLRLRMTGDAAAEPSDASATLLLDITKREWSPELLAAVGVEERLLPPLLPSATVAGRLTPAAALDLGLAPGTPVVAGAGDQAAQALGNGVIGSDMASCTIGTGGQVLQPAGRPTADAELRVHCFCHAVPDTWFLMGAMLSAGLSLRWWRDLLGLAGSEAYETLGREAAAVPPGSEGLLFLPYLLGERTPHMDSTARGAFVGLTLRHGRGHLVRAIMEGVTFALRDGLELLGQLCQPPARMVASGGGARSPVWLQMQADVFGKPMTTVLGEERAVVGAAMLAGIGVGTFDSLHQAAEACVRFGGDVSPSSRAAGSYESYYAEFRSLYPALCPSFRSLGRLANV
ncbi:MAG: xylulokinase [Anaerolineae bacterium]